MSNEEYNLGYFEGVRNVFMALHSLTEDDFNIWLADELAEAKKLRDEE